MPTLEFIKETITQINPVQVNRLLRMKEIPELVSILNNEEIILRITPAFLKVDSGKSGIFIATNIRCFFLYKGGLITEVMIEQFPYDKISSVEYKSGLMFTQMVIHTSGNSIKLDNIAKDEIRELCEFLNSTASHRSHASIAPSNAKHEDTISQLERLAALKDRGILTDEEFLSQKKKILES